MGTVRPFLPYDNKHVVLEGRVLKWARKLLVSNQVTKIVLN